MRIAHLNLAAALTGLAIAGFTAQVQAQDSARDAAMHRCILAVQAQYPSTSGEQQEARVAAYKACMTQAGFNP